MPPTASTDECIIDVIIRIIYICNYAVTGKSSQLPPLYICNNAHTPFALIKPMPYAHALCPIDPRNLPTPDEQKTPPLTLGKTSFLLLSFN